MISSCSYRVTVNKVLEKQSNEAGRELELVLYGRAGGYREKLCIHALKTYMM